MSIFKRSGHSDAQQSSTPAAPGVVPPPAAPIYSMRPAQPPLATSIARRSARRIAPVVARTTRPQACQPCDTERGAQAALLNLAWTWQESGAPIQAIHAYVELLNRYPETAAADAAVADLVELANKLVGQGNFHTALGIYRELERFPDLWADE